MIIGYLDPLGRFSGLFSGLGFRVQVGNHGFEVEGVVLDLGLQEGV